jgi:hypothetical protein
MIAGLAALLLATIAAIELTWVTRVLPGFGALNLTALHAGRIVMRRHVSEWAKERAMRLMSARLMGQSLRGAALLGVVASPFVLAMAIEAVRPFGLHQAYANWPARLGLLALSIIYVTVRRRFRHPAVKAPVARPKERPSLERTWQRMALGNPAVLDMTFDIERAFAKPWPSDAAGAPIFLAGLARAGTTILTRILHEQHGMASLTYRDLPFPLAPNGWGRISGRLGRKVERTERGHGDGLFHDLDSAEAIEEVFWRHHEGTRYARPHGLSLTAPRPETVSAFRDYVGLVRRSHGGARYLSKNNANVLRLPALADAFPEAVLLHPFRAPLQQAHSLLRQHRLARQWAAQDPYRAEFMTWLGHHEFGADQRPFLFPGHPPADADRDHIDYWLQVWISVHTALLVQSEPVRARQVFLDYDALCAGAAGQADRLAAALGLDNLALHDLRAAPWREVNGARPGLLARAQVVHARLRARSLNSTARVEEQRLLHLVR